MKVLVSSWPPDMSAKLPMNLHFWVFSFQPSTLTAAWCREL
jgi:hypothetical protein